jgi:hypothetical protein
MAHQQLGDKVQACHCYGHAVVWMASNKQFIANHKNVAYEGGGIYNAGTLTVSNTFN